MFLGFAIVAKDLVQFDQLDVLDLLASPLLLSLIPGAGMFLLTFLRGISGPGTS